MYLAHFGLQEFPFSITPNTPYFFSSKTSREALNTLLVAVSMGEGFMKITGEVGTGKTMLCRMLLDSLGDEYAVAYIFNPNLEPLALFIEVGVELGLPRPPVGMQLNQHDVLHVLTNRVLELNQSGHKVVICLDEVQAMPVETLEALRLLTNLETEQEKLLQVIIFGQPELDEKLNHPSVRQLRQRITFHYRLMPLSKGEFNYYIHHRLAAAGNRRGQLFTPGALWLLERKSGRVPRLINILANKALLAAFGKHRPVVGWRDVMSAARDTESIQNPKTSRKWLRLVGLVVAAVVLGLALGGLWRYVA